VDLRWPIEFPRKERQGATGGEEADVDTLRLLRPEQIPPGFVYVSAGWVQAIDDEHAFQGLEPGLHEVEGFFIGRLEVTLREWLEFLNDPTVSARIASESGLAAPRDPGLLGESPKGKDPVLVRLVPIVDRLPIVARKDGAGPWSIVPGRGLALDRPVPGVTQQAAREFAFWRTQRARRDGKPWVFRLPTDLEWERAARGGDRRRFVWGDYFAWPFCFSLRGHVLDRQDAGLSTWAHVAADESVFGVLDLAGSMTEHTLDRPHPLLRSTSYRGGSWDNPDAYYFHIATRNSYLPTNAYRFFGFRLVAELQPSPGG
jgi:serine/threonine-protein kinase